MTIYDALSKDHREFERLLERLLLAAKSEDDTWEDILDDLRRGLIAHAHAEEAVFYNALRETDQGEGLIGHAYGEHLMAESEIRALGAAKLVDANWPSLVEKLRHDLLHHIAEEETRVFDAARRAFNAEEAEQLALAFEQMKTATAKDGDSIVASTLDLIANLMPPRLTALFRKNTKPGHWRAA
ncbi:MAG TPA: hemerythrin domain-containing protein [Polyangiaceae bacterium]|nr:hemerythrin domain-containing protein [Polyangiaceae bacterium]